LEGAIEAAQAQDVSLVAFAGSELGSPFVNRCYNNSVYKLATSQNMDALLLLSSTLTSYIDAKGMADFLAQYPVPQVSLGIKLPDVLSLLHG